MTPVHASSAPAKVLLVEDHAHERWALATALQWADLDVDVAETASEAIRLLDLYGSLYRCILLDIELPHVNGFAVAEYVKRMQAKTPVIVISGHSNLSAPLRSGGYAEIVKCIAGKPLDVSLIATIVREFVNLDMNRSEPSRSSETGDGDEHQPLS